MSPGTFVKEIVDELVRKGNSVDILSLKPNNISKQFINNTYTNYSTFDASSVGKFIRLIKTIASSPFLFINDLKLVEISSISDFVQFTINYKLVKNINKYDVINIQGISLPPFWGGFINSNATLIASFLGSDILLRERDEKVFQRKKYWIDKAKNITISSTKMVHIFQMKYGIRNLPKLVQVLYLQREELYNHIDLIKRKKSGKIRIAIGYNGYSAQNHLEILEQISLLNPEVKDRISLFFYFQYGGSAQYRQTVIQMAEETTIPFVVQKNIMTISELAQAKIDTDIQIITPDSDAFCGAVSESLFSGTVLVTGKWLPYERYLENDVYFESVQSFQELSSKLTNVIQNFNELSYNASKNRHNVLKTLDTKKNLQVWSDLLTN